MLLVVIVKAGRTVFGRDAEFGLTMSLLCCEKCSITDTYTAQRRKAT